MITGHNLRSTQTNGLEFSDESLNFGEEIVAKKMLRLSSVNSAGPDGLHPALLMGCVESMARPLSMILRKSFESENYQHSTKGP